MSVTRLKAVPPQRLFIEVTPGIRRALELLAEASITLLDEIDAPVDGLEADEDFEVTFEDDEDGDPGEDVGDGEPDLGWGNEPQLCGVNHAAGDASDEDFVEPETSGGFSRDPELPRDRRAIQRALFDPRIASRQGVSAIMTTGGYRYYSVQIPRFPHEPPDRPKFHLDHEMWRLRKEIADIAGRRQRSRRRRRA